MTGTRPDDPAAADDGASRTHPSGRDISLHQDVPSEPILSREPLVACGPSGVSGIVLAAGRSTRMGSPKPLLPLGGQALLRHVVLAARASRLDEVLVVVGYEADRVVAALGDSGHRVIPNPAYLDGQASSLRVGVTAVSPRARAVMVLLGDQPEVTTAVIDAMIEAHATTGAMIVRPSYRRVPGHPVLFDRRLVADLLALSGDTGARDLLRRHAGEIRQVEIDTDPPPDVDTPEAFAALVARWPSG